MRKGLIRLYGQIVWLLNSRIVLIERNCLSRSPTVDPVWAKSGQGVHRPQQTCSEAYSRAV
jgi:hypothetical protein